MKTKCEYIKAKVDQKLRHTPYESILMNLRKHHNTEENLKRQFQHFTKENPKDKERLRTDYKAAQPQKKDGETLKAQKERLATQQEILARYIFEQGYKKAYAKATPLLKCMAQFVQIIKNDKELNNFLSNPDAYCDANNQLSLRDHQILEWVVNDPQFEPKFLPPGSQLAKQRYFTLITRYMYALEREHQVSEFASMDAVTFQGCINPQRVEAVLERNKKTMKNRLVWVL